ncbi:MAG: NUDIX domain-containing protein [Marmoricola sp.]
MTDDLRDEPASWPVSHSRDVHHDDWILGVREDFLSRPGHPDDVFRRLVIEHPGAVLVLALDEEERACCIRQYRHNALSRMVELPAGVLDVPGEDPVETAKRELREEAELQAEHWRHLLSVYPSAGISQEVHHLYLATGLSPAERGDFAMQHEEAELERFWVPLEELQEAVLSGRVRQGPVAMAVLAYQVLKCRGALDES